PVGPHPPSWRLEFPIEYVSETAARMSATRESGNGRPRLSMPRMRGPGLIPDLRFLQWRCAAKLAKQRLLF
ncbi:MAG: hypothetical protein ACJ8DL_08815, partial [Microvirga sp.]